MKSELKKQLVPDRVLPQLNILLFSFRPRAWQHLCGARFRMTRHPKAFDHFVQEPGEQKWIDDIQKDLHRNFPNHELFGGTYEHIGR